LRAGSGDPRKSPAPPRDRVAASGPDPNIPGMKRMRGSRRRIWLAAGALVAGGAVAAGWRASRGGGLGPDPFQDYARRFWLSHEALRRNLDRFLQIEREEPVNVAAFGAYVELYARFLMVHHEAEDEVIFPTFRRHGRLRSTDAAHLADWSSEHRQINQAGAALERAGQAARTGGRPALAEVGRVSRALSDLLQPHLAAEEQLFTAEHLSEIVPPRAIAEIDRTARRRFSRAREIPLFFAHSLNEQEQREVFGRAPWIFRKVVFPLMDRRADFPRFSSFVVSPSLAA